MVPAQHGRVAAGAHQRARTRKYSRKDLLQIPTTRRPWPACRSKPATSATAWSGVIRPDSFPARRPPIPADGGNRSVRHGRRWLGRSAYGDRSLDPTSPTPRASTRPFVAIFLASRRPGPTIPHRRAVDSDTVLRSGKSRTLQRSVCLSRGAEEHCRSRLSVKYTAADIPVKCRRGMERSREAGSNLAWEPTLQRARHRASGPSWGRVDLPGTLPEEALDGVAAGGESRKVRVRRSGDRRPATSGESPFP